MEQTDIQKRTECLVTDGRGFDRTRISREHIKAVKYEPEFDEERASKYTLLEMDLKDNEFDIMGDLEYTGVTMGNFFKKES